MNIPNQLTIARFILAPVFLIFLLWQSLPHYSLIAFIIFVAAAVTDFIDGKLARRNDQITVFGKFLDPVADKMLVTAALLGLMKMGLCNIWVVMLVLTREFIVTSVRLVASSDGNVIAANIWGKLKTASQMIFISLVLLLNELLLDGILPGAFPLAIVSNVLMWIIAGLTVVSGATYVYGARKHISVKK